MADDSSRRKVNTSWDKLALTVMFCFVVIIFIVLGITAIPKNDTKTTADDPSALSAKQIISVLSSNLQGEPLKIQESSAKNGLTTTGHVAYSASYYGPSEFQTQPDKLYGVAVQGSLDTTNNDYDQTVAYMRNNGFNERESYIGQDGETFIRQTSYETKKAVCHISQTSLLETQINSLAVGIGCADISGYARVASIVEPFYDVFADANPEQSKNLYIDVPDISNGERGYQNAIVLINDFAALFYKTPDSNWKYFASVEQMPFCSFYDTTDLKKSFSGQSCYDLDKRKQVRL